METTQQYVYQTYVPRIPLFMSGYTGHIPNTEEEEYVNRIVRTKEIPGYAGFVQSIYAENKYGESYGKETAKSLAHTIPQGADVPPNIRYTSTHMEDYKDQSKVKTQSTASLLGIREPNVTYKKPLPVDTINKFFGVESKGLNSHIIEKQSFERNYEKFWEFLDSNELDYNPRKVEDFNESNMKYWGVQHSVQELHPELKFDPIPGYMGVNRSIVSENIFGMTYKNSLRKADEVQEKMNLDRASQLYRSAHSYYKNY